MARNMRWKKDYPRYNLENSSYHFASDMDETRRVNFKVKRLFVENIPVTITKNILYDIFEEFGPVVDITICELSLSQKFKSAIVEYSHLESAEEAIYYLDRCPPYNFVVNHEDQKKLKYKCQEYEEPINNHVRYQPQRHNFGRPAAYTEEAEEDFSNCEQDFSYDARYRGSVLDDVSGIRTVSNKTGKPQVTVVTPSIPLSSFGPTVSVDLISAEVRQTVDKAITNLMVKLQKESGAGDIGDSDKPFGSCSVCGIMTTKACSRCQLWYCSRNCQVKDWPFHMQHCMPIPNLECVKHDKLPELNKPSPANEDDKFKHPVNFNNHGRGDGHYRRDDRFGSRTVDENSKFDDKNSDFEVGNKYCNKNNRFGVKNADYEDKNKAIGDRNNRYGDANKGFEANQNKGFGYKNFEDRNRTFGNDRNGGFNRKVGENRYGGNFRNDRREFGRTSQSQNDSHLFKGSTVQDAEDTQFWDENVKTTSTPVRDETPKANTVVKTTEVSCKPNVTEEPLKSIESKVEALSSSSPLLPVGVFKEVTVTYVIDEGHFIVQLNDLLPSYKEMLCSLNDTAATADSITIAEKVKCIVQCKVNSSEEMWFRGLVKSVSPLSVLLVDYGITELVSPERIKAIPEEFVKFQKMAVRIKLAPGTRGGFYRRKPDDSFYVKAVTKDLEGAIIVEVKEIERISPPRPLKTEVSVNNTVVGNEINCEVTKVNVNSSVEVSLQSDIKEVDIGLLTVNPGQPSLLEQRTLLKTGSNVTLGYVYSFDCLYVISMEPSDLEVLTNITKLGQLCKNAPKLEKNPEVGDLVACFFPNDNDWYRAKILEKDGDKYKVFFVDYGNLEVATMEQMKTLPDSFGNIPYTAVKVGLANSSDKPITGALKFLNEIITCSEELKIDIKDDDLTSVTLFRKNGQSLNEEINSLIGPNTRGLEAEANDIITIDQLPEYKLSVGAELEIMLFLFSPPRVLIVTDTKSEPFRIVVTELTDKLQKYCKGLPDAVYKPRDGELCAVLFDEDQDWYRAVCLETCGEKSKVMFIDYGNECLIEHANIRKLTTDFTRTPAMAFVCTYEVIPEKCTKTLLKRLEELVQKDEYYKLVVKSQDEGCYNVDIPSVTLILQKEGLL